MHKRLHGLERPKITVKTEPPRKVPDGMPRLPMLCLIWGSSGQGKTTALLEMLTIYNREGSIDNVYLFSPTYRMDPKQKLIGELPGKQYEFDAIEHYSDEALTGIITGIKGRVERHRYWVRYNEAYKKFVACRSEKELTKRLTADDFLLLQERDFEPLEPVCKHGQFPQSMLIFDDLAGNSKLFTSNGKGVLGQFLILARHWGTSIIVLSQTRTCLNKQLRSNLNTLVLFRCKSKSIQSCIADEFCSYCSEDEFVSMWDTATTEPNDFFLVDLRDREKMFRKNWDCVLSKPTL